MARNEEKAMAMLNRWWNMKKDLGKAPVRERPKTHQRIMQLNRLNDCERYRRSILKEISKSVSIIQNAGLGEHKIREINDEINKLIKEKASYESRIKELGGPDYKVNVQRLFDDEGDILPGSGDYFYFGAAKDLPGVRDLFQKKRPEAPRRNMLEIYKGLDYEEYFGKRDDLNQQLLADEAEVEAKIRKEERARWATENRELIQQKLNKADPTEEELQTLIDELADVDSDEDDDHDERRRRAGDDEDMDQEGAAAAASVPAVPKKLWEDMTEEERYLEKKKNELLAKYLGVKDNTAHLTHKKPLPEGIDVEESDKRAMIEEIITMQKE